MENGRVVEVHLDDFDLWPSVPAEIGQLTSLDVLELHGNRATSVPAEIAAHVAGVG